MKKLALPLALFLMTALLLHGSAPLPPAAKATLFQHLTEVNKQWLAFPPGAFLLEKVVFENDNQRIQAHLRLVEQVLRSRELPLFSKKQLEKRRHHLDILHGYQLAGIWSMALSVLLKSSITGCCSAAILPKPRPSTRTAST